MKVEVFPPTESATTPFLVVQLKPVRWFPSVPFSTKIMPYLGLDVHLVQPPLPASGQAGEEELTGSKGWLKSLLYLYSPNASPVWVDVQQPADAGNASDDDGATKEWWPTIKPWGIGLWLRDATLVVETPEKIR